MDVRKCTDNQIIGDHDLNGNDERVRSVISREENEAFLLMEQELLNEQENDKNVKHVIRQGGQTEGKNGKDSSQKNKIRREGQKGVVEVKCDGVSRDKVERNGILEFAVLLDQSTTSQLYLKLLHGIENSHESRNENESENKNDFKIIHTPNNDTTEMFTDDDQNNRQKQKRKIIAENDFNGLSSSVKKMKTNQQVNENNVLEDNDEEKLHVNKRNSNDVCVNGGREVNDINGMNIDENDKNLLDKERNKLLNDVSVGTCLSHKECYSRSLFLDDVTRERLCVLHKGCVGKHLEDLILSKEMLMLMGYTGSDGESGKKVFRSFS